MTEFDYLKKYLKSIKKRDDFKCQNPECRNKGKGKQLRLTIHQIDNNPDNYEPWNLITLCLGCKVETRYRKEYVQYIYSELINLKYPNNWEHLQKKRIKANH